MTMMIRPKHGLALTALLVGMAQIAGAQKGAALNPRVDLILEKKEGNTVRQMDPTHVFAEGDWIRFRVRSGINGFLYVMNRNSSGKYEQLFPRTGGSPERSVKAGKEYVVPDSEGGWFRVQAPAGYETVYFLVSPMDLGKSLPADAPGNEGTGEPHESSEQHEVAADAFATATPRCDDELFRARGECLDTSAGLKPVLPGEKLPVKFAQVPTVTSRDLVVVKESNDTSVSSTEPFDAPVIYHFRIAHK